MGESNGEWGALAEYDAELAAIWDGYERLPEPDTNAALDAFVARKNLTIPNLVRLGARMSTPTVLAFAFAGGIKYRDIITSRRWSTSDAAWHGLKVIPAGAERTRHVIVAEGETDAARLSAVYTCDVAILPAGALYFPQAFADQLADYEIILVGLDADEAGERGALKIMELLPQALRFAPPAVDWCEAEEFPPLPTEAPVVIDELVPAGALLELEVPDVASWYEHAVLPIGGQLILHGWTKNYKSFVALDLLAAIAQAQDWACFEPTEEPCKVCVVQFEIPWPYYRERVELLMRHAREPDLFRENFLTWTPMRRPQLIAGNTKHEDHILTRLVAAGVQVCLFDPIRRLTGSIDMNSEGEVRPTLHFFQRLQDEGITVVTVHHDNKQGARAGGSDPTNMTGSGAWAGDADTIVGVSIPRSGRPADPTRNLDFTLRNAPSIPPRGFGMQDDSRLLYSPEPYGPGFEDEEDAPSI